MLPMTSRLLRAGWTCLSCFFAILVAAITLVPTKRRSTLTDECTLRSDAASFGSRAARSDLVSASTKLSQCSKAFVSSTQKASLTALYSASVLHASSLLMVTLRSSYLM